MRRLGDNFSTVTAPFVIVLTFGQTLGSLLDLECPWPNLLREWMQMLDIFNINLELARYDHACHRPLLSSWRRLIEMHVLGRPECSGNYSAKDKMLLTLAAPVLLLAIVLAYAVIRTFANAVQAMRAHPADAEASWWDVFKAREHQAAKKAVATATSIFVVASIFFFRCCLKPFKCEDDGTGAQFMVSNPEVECGDNDEYNELRRLGTLGLIAYMAVYITLTACLAWATTLCEHGKYDKMGRLSYLSFLGDKYEPRCFFWESGACALPSACCEPAADSRLLLAVVLARKIGLMVAFFAFEGQESWLLAVLVIGVALMAHVAFRPFEAPLTDMTETFSLVANMILLVSVPVYRILQSDHADTRRAGRVVSVMEMLAVVLIIAVCVVGGYAQLHIFRVVADPSDGDDPGKAKDDADLGEMEMREDESRISYKQRMLQRRLEQKQAEAAVLRQGVESYRAYQEHELREVRSALPGLVARAC